MSREARRSRTAGGFRAFASAWLIGPMMLGATVCGALLVLRGPDRAFTAALVALFGTALAWILVSTLWPASSDRICPACGTRNLRRMDARSTRGVVCDRCDHQDADRSSFLLAEEEEGAIEAIRIDERGWKRGSTS